MKKITLALALAGMAGWSSPAISHQNDDYYFGSDENYVHFDSDADTDGDGRLSFEEYKAQKNRWDSDDDDQIFHDIDDNSDGYIEEDELADYVEVRVSAAMEALDNLDFDVDIDFDFDNDFEMDDDGYAFEYRVDEDDLTDEERREMREMRDEMRHFGREMRDMGRDLGRGIGRAMRGVFRGGRGDHSSNYVYISRGNEVEEQFGLDSRSFYIEQEYGDDVSLSNADFSEIVEKRKDSILAEMDENGDGAIAESEFKGPSSAFENMDENDDGTLTRDELEIRVSLSRVVRVPEIRF